MRFGDFEVDGGSDGEGVGVLVWVIVGVIAVLYAFTILWRLESDYFYYLLGLVME